MTTWVTKVRTVLLCTGPGLAAYAPASAAPVSAAAPRDTLGTAVIVAERLPASLTAGGTAQSLDTLAMRRRGVTDIADALRRMAGVNLRDYGGAGGLKTVSVRGLGAAHTAVSYNGLPVADARNGSIDLSRFTTDRLATVGLEVGDAGDFLAPVRSLAAARVVLTSPLPDPAADPADADRRLSGSATLRQGSFGTVSPSVSLAGPVGTKTALGVSADFFHARNDYPFTLENGVATERRRREGSRMQTWNAEAVGRTRLEGGELRYLATWSDSHRRLPGSVHYYTAKATEHLTERAAAAGSTWRQRFGRWEAMAAAKFDYSLSDYTDRSAQYPGGRLEQRYHQRQWYATAGTAVSLGSVRLAYAADGEAASLNSNLSTDPHASRLTLLQALSARWQWHGLTLTGRATLHLCDNRRDGATPARNARRLTPMASAVWTVRETEHTAWRVRAFYHELFRLPTFTESYFYHLGSQDLRPELTRQAGGGTTLLLRDATPWWPMLTVTADAYHNRVSDLIMSIPYNLFVWRTTNVGRAVTTGLDVTLESRFRPAPRHALLLAANYSLQHAEDRSLEGTATYGRQMAYTPRHSGATSLSWENPWCNLVVHTTFASSRWSNNEHLAGTGLPGYAETGFAAYRSWTLRRCRLAARADLVNAFDKQYAVIRRYPMPGRAYRLSLTVAW